VEIINQGEDLHHDAQIVKLAPGKTAATMRLEAGNYVVLCLIPDRHGVPHVALRMGKTALGHAGWRCG
jgi:hypothetical protein